ncbi:MAG: OmpA family protein [Bacteroidia bacterium]
MYRLLSIIFTIFLLPAFSVGQSAFTIEGRVSDSATGKPVEGAVVTIKCNDTAIDTKADVNGKFSFRSPLIKADKIYVIYARTDNHTYGYSGGKEAYVSTYGYNNKPRKFIRNIELAKNSVKDYPAVPSAHVQFQYIQNSIPNKTKDSALNAWLQCMLDNPTFAVEIDGYSDKKEGNKTVRYMLSSGRAQECIDYLHANGIDYARMKLAGNGDHNPVYSQKAIRKLKGKDAKIAARLQNCRAEINLKNIFFRPPLTVIINGMVSNINSGLHISKALVQLNGSDGTLLTYETDPNGKYSLTIKNFNPFVIYSVTAEAIGYNPSDPDDVYKITPENSDQPVYSHDFRLEKNGIEKQPIFPPIDFDSGSAALSKPAIDSLNRLMKIMAQRPGLVMEFMGDADWHETDYVNLAVARAQACVDFMVQSGIDRERFVVASRLNEKGIEDEEKYTTGIVKHKEKQRRFNPKECTVSFWPVNWTFTKSLAQ